MPGERASTIAELRNCRLGNLVADSCGMVWDARGLKFLEIKIGELGEALKEF